MRMTLLFLVPILWLGCQTEGSDLSLEIRAVEAEAAPALTAHALVGSSPAETLFVHEEVLLDEADFISATILEGGAGPSVEATLSDSGRERLAEVSARFLGKRLGILVDGRLISAPTVRDTITGGRLRIMGEFSPDEARRIAEGLRGGALAD